MNWYYASDGQRKGPLGEQEIEALVGQGVVTEETLVWREGMENWEPYGALRSRRPGAEPGVVTCASCGGGFPAAEVITLADRTYCGACKPAAVQRLREGLVSSTAAEAIRHQHLKHEASVRSIGFLYYFGGAAFLLMGAMRGVLATRWAGGVGAADVVTMVILLGLGAGQIVTATGLRRLRPWARIPTAIISGVGLLAFPIGTLINAYILYLVFSRKGRMVFSEEYRAVMEQTPQIKYKSSKWIWVLFGLLALLCGLGGLAIYFAPRG